MIIVSATISLLLLIAGITVIVAMITPNTARIAYVLMDVDHRASPSAPVLPEPVTYPVTGPRVVARSILPAAA